MSKTGRKILKNTMPGSLRVLQSLLICVLGIIPLVTRLEFYKLNAAEEQYFPGPSVFGDLYGLWKSRFVLLCGLIIICVLLQRNNRLKLKSFINSNTLITVPILIYSVEILLSAILSKYKGISFLGFVDSYQGALTLLSYVFIFLAAMLYASEGPDLSKIIKCFIISGSVISIIGILQVLGFDILKNGFVFALISPIQYLDYAQNVHTSFSNNMAYATLSNPNYAGSFAVLLFFMSLGYTLYHKDKKSVIFGAAATLLSFLFLLGTMSRAGYLGGLAGSVVFGILACRSLKTLYKKLLFFIAAMIICAVALNVFTKGWIFTEAQSIVTFGAVESYEAKKQMDRPTVKNILLDGYTAEIETSRETFGLDYIESPGIIKFVDKKQKDLAYEIDQQGIITFTDPLYSQYKVKVNSESGLINIKYYDAQMDILLTKNGFVYPIIKAASGMKVAVPEKVTWFNEKFASKRGYIWDVSIPLLKKSIFFGNGPDTFPIYFPQTDMVGKLNNFGDTTKGITKPHNWFLQVGIENGLIAMFALVAFLVIYFMQTLSLYLKKRETAVGIWFAAIPSAIAAYCVSGIFNDSNIVVAPVFWALIGIGAGMNIYIVTKRGMA